MERNMAAPPPGQQAQPTNIMPQAIVNENVDLSIQIPTRICRLTVSKLPSSATQVSKIPLGGLVRPLAPDGPEDEEIPTVQPGSAGIVRCKRCRSYMNAFVTWTEHGRRWRCNICAQMNDTPAAYFCHLDERGWRHDRADRPELSKGCVEFIAPAEYMVRPPQEPTYFFVLDVTATAVRSGMLESAARAIKSSLDQLPGGGRTKIGFITFDNAVHYFNLSSELANPQMLVVSDLKELFVPLPDNLLVNLQESRKVVEAFLDSLPEMFQKNPVEGLSCLGPALKAAFTVMKAVGGKMCVFQSIMPNLGDGALKPREQPGIMGTPNEIKLIKPEISWYKDTAIEFSRQQISVNLFLFPYQYMDLASLGELPKYTAGTMYSYVMFSAQRDGQRFEEQLQKTLTQTTAFEAVMRIRCTKGIRITNVYGNFYIRGTDLLALPNCNTESVFAFDLAHDEQNVASSHVTIQAALLYTSSDGERRIRVMTQALPVTSSTSDIIASVDGDACAALLAKQALDIALKTSLDNARMRLQQVCVDIIRTAKGGDARKVSGYSVPPPHGHQADGDGQEEKAIPENLQLLPLYVLATMKNVAFRGGTDVHPDERVQAHHLLTNMFVKDSKHFVYPRMFSIHDMDDSAGEPVEDNTEDDENENAVAGRNRIRLPEIVSLTIDSLSSNGVFLLDNGVDMYLWVGRNADINVIGSLFGVISLDEMDPNQLEVLTSGDPFASRFGEIVQALREDVDYGNYISAKIHVVLEGDHKMEGRFFWFLVEDRASFQGGTYSYSDFMEFVQNPNNASSGRPGPAAPPGAPRPPDATNPPPGQGMGSSATHLPSLGQVMGPPAPQMPPTGYSMGSGPGVPHSAPPGHGVGSPHPPPPGYGVGPVASHSAPPAQAPGRGASFPPPPGQSTTMGTLNTSAGPPARPGPLSAPPMASYSSPSASSSQPQYPPPPAANGPPSYPQASQSGPPRAPPHAPPVASSRPGPPPPPGRPVQTQSAPYPTPPQPPSASHRPPPPRGSMPPPPPPPPGSYTR